MHKVSLAGEHSAFAVSVDEASAAQSPSLRDHGPESVGCFHHNPTLVSQNLWHLIFGSSTKRDVRAFRHEMLNVVRGFRGRCRERRSCKSPMFCRRDCVSVAVSPRRSLRSTPYDLEATKEKNELTEVATVQVARVQVARIQVASDNSRACSRRDNTRSTEHAGHC